MPSYNLPNEIYGEIAHHLQGRSREDMNALLNLARVNQFWRDESQKMIFEKVGSWKRVVDDTDLGPSVDTHLRFLQALMSDPTRLGPYVTTYAQQNVAFDPDSVSFSIDETMEPMIQIWRLMKEALPHMVNLKVFNFQPQFCALRHGPLAGCSFQLQSLTWFHVGDSIQDLGPFLRTQHHLRHLEAVASPLDQTLDWLPGPSDACPDLVSISCHLDAVPSLARRPAITSLDLYMMGAPEYSATGHIPTVLSRLKYLRLHALMIPDGFPGMVLENIVLLELGYWDLEDLRLLSSFPGLEVLGLHYGRRRLSETQLNMTGIPVCFQQCPRLRRVLARDFGDDGVDTLLTVTRREGGFVGVSGKVARREDDIHIAWWSVYETEF